MEMKCIKVHFAPPFRDVTAGDRDRIDKDTLFSEEFSA